MCFKKWFGKEEEVVEEVPVERKPVDELLESINNLAVQLNLVVEDNKKLEERIKQLEQEKQNEYEATCKAKDQIVDLLNEKAELEARLREIRTLAGIQ
jgi:hydroxymethylpyrimidine pyrophosphatase-like HAD family hydrolase